MSGAGIHVRDVTRRFGSFVAVEDVSFAVEPGEVVGLLGPNGAGKTTTLRMIATLLRPDAGSVSVAGYDVASAPGEVKARLGYQTGDTGLYARLTPREFLAYFGALHGVPEPLLARRVNDLVERFGITEFANRLCGNLSTGQKQRVSLARTLVNDPPVIVLDEPTNGLDILSSSFILESLRGLARDGRAILFSTHVLSEVELICDRILCMHRGRIVARNTVGGLLAATGEPTLARAFLATLHASDAARPAGDVTARQGGTP